LLRRHTVVTAEALGTCVCVDDLLTVAACQCCGRVSNPRSVDRKSSALTTIGHVQNVDDSSLTVFSCHLTKDI